MWSHPEHTIEFTPDEICECLELAGFTSIVIRGVWLCYDSEIGRVLPLTPADSPPEWPWLRRIQSAASKPADSFVWWVEAQRRAPR
jgi:hypothetical protein